MREEKDSLGKVLIDEKSPWGSQTQRSLLFFGIGNQKMPIEIIKALLWIKKVAAESNAELGVLDKEKAVAISEIVSELVESDLEPFFPLSLWQTGSGTQSNMNTNEVIANLANEKQGNPYGSKFPIHPNDDVNRSQSSNDVFPTAIHIAVTKYFYDELLPALELLVTTLEEKAEIWADVQKVGRTHMMDAVPISLGKEFSSYAFEVQKGVERAIYAAQELLDLAIGGTAVGSGLNTPFGFKELFVQKLSEYKGLSYRNSSNLYAKLAFHGDLLFFHGALKTLACALMKISNDIRLMGSGPRAGLSELFLPENEPGSSIMPGKVNPTQVEALNMVAAYIMGNDTSLTIAASQGQFELNVFKPFIAYVVLETMHLLRDSVSSFVKNCLVGLEPNYARLEEYNRESIMVATALNPILGYDKVAQIVKKAIHENMGIKEACVELGFLSSEEFDKYTHAT